MKLISVVALLAAPFAASATRLSWDSVYDQGTQSLSTVACSDGSNGLLARYGTFGGLPTFPRIGGSSEIANWNSPNCGTCWNVTFQGITTTVTIIDRADDGFNLSKDIMNGLTNNQADFTGQVDATGVQVPKSLCGLPE